MRVGGPGTWLPSPVESFLSWALAVSFLSVSGYHNIVDIFIAPTWTRFKSRIFLLLGSASHSSKHGRSAAARESFPCWLPLTTASRAELERATPLERFQQCVHVLSSLKHVKLSSDDALVQAIRQNPILRRLVSLAMRPLRRQTATPTSATSTVLDPTQTTLGQRLIRLWPKLLSFPPIPTKEKSNYDISVILPAYRERGSDVAQNLQRALQSSRNASRIQVIVVDAGECENLQVILQPSHDSTHEDAYDDVRASTRTVPTSNTTTTTVSESLVKDSQQSWGELLIVPFFAGGGRGPCLNHGAEHAAGRVYTFLHSDTTLPHEWDARIVQTFLDDTPPQDDNARPNSAAFGFGIDTSPARLEQNGGYFPPGIRAVETTANLRCHLWSLPYGDQSLSIPAVYFNYLGGFPDQCLMEDYELISLLRKRVALLHQFQTPQEPKERLVILGGPPALCSPRRWQKYGVLYVTYMNSTFVNLYAGGLSPDELFQLYYSRPPPQRMSPLAPWEEEMKHVIQE